MNPLQRQILRLFLQRLVLLETQMDTLEQSTAEALGVKIPKSARKGAKVVR